ncbi:uncharacterized protein PGRI_019900 [Penicillium griseofulvum]|uniref:Calycin n=1 Tax=Penicillium patulum TaxID=5078 RepID=A0A135LGU4_PENPA|nr:uncharacterized protein PGRI_019900 [Penicillium griseofulvum]KXG48120.1 hypothetical protein PGRI_019900 [Penicillium griseofulvum]
MEWTPYAMAAPQEITIESLSGHWVLVNTLSSLEDIFQSSHYLQNKDLSSETDPILKLQKVPWLLRKAFGFATIHIQITQYPTPSTTSLSTNIDFLQTSTASLAPTKEERILDWKILHHEDYFFGQIQGQSEFVRGVTDADGSIRPEFKIQTENATSKIKLFLRGEIEADGSKFAGFIVEDCSNPGLGLWVHTFERNVKAEWTAEQIWGFEMFGGERYFSRRIVVMTKGEYICGRIVFDFVNL